jgi:hypothetical protein
LLDLEPGIVLPIYRLYAEPHYSRPPRWAGPAILYVAHDSSLAELAVEPLIRQALEEDSNTAVYAVDVFGLGESRPNTCGENSYASNYGCDYFYASHLIMRDRTYVGQRAIDIKSALNFLEIQGGHTNIHLIAKGYGAIPAAFASLYGDNPTRVTLRNTLTSYGDLAAADVYKWPLSSLVPSVLKHYDLPDVYRVLKKNRHLSMIDPLGPGEKPV